jgi:hypothetical protein
MASGGWGGAYSNPFAAQEAAAAAAAAEEKASAAGRQGQAYGAWSGGATPAASAPAVPAFVAPTPVVASAGGNVTAREAELLRREAELSRREAQLAQAGVSGVIKVCTLVSSSKDHSRSRLVALNSFAEVASIWRLACTGSCNQWYFSCFQPACAHSLLYILIFLLFVLLAPLLCPATCVSNSCLLCAELAALLPLHLP